MHSTLHNYPKGKVTHVTSIHTAHNIHIKITDGDMFAVILVRWKVCPTAVVKTHLR